MTVDTECEACNGTGLYSGRAEPEGVAVVCLRCTGTGCFVFRYKPFKKRKGRKGISTVRVSRGALIVDCGPTGGSVTYEEFKKGEMP